MDERRRERLDAAKAGLRAVERYIFYELSDENESARAEQVQKLLRLAVGLKRKLNAEE